ncbi:MAG TPA: twin-arginine translocation pathway signal [Mycobacterium sp.]|nr:twin-arginine translocation pathway signal [Mycobacterium sp.]
MTVDQEQQVDDADSTDDLGVDDAGREDTGVRKRWLGATVGWMRGRLVRWRLILLTVAVVAAVGLAAGLFFFQYRPDQQTDNAAAHAVIAAASEGSVAILSYTPATVDNDLAVAQSHLTGEFGRYYREFGQHYVAPAVRQQDVKASATVLRAGVSELRPDSAVVLLFIHQTTISKDKPQPLLTSSNVRATLTKVSGSWLISQFEPI